MEEPVRLQHEKKILRTPRPDSEDITLQEQANAIFKTANNGVKVIGGTVQLLGDCGCLEDIGGICDVCVAEGSGGITCVYCFHHCSQSDCGVALCLKHSFQFEDAPGEFKRLCPTCSQPRKTRKRRLLILKRIFFPIIILYKLLEIIFFKPGTQNDERLPEAQIELHPLKPTQQRHFRLETHQQRTKPRNDE